MSAHKIASYKKRDTTKIRALAIKSKIEPGK
jgi:hypothetical protein